MQGWTKSYTSITCPRPVTSTIFRGVFLGQVTNSKPAFKSILTTFSHVLSWHNLCAVGSCTEAKKKTHKFLFPSDQRLTMLRK